MVARAHFCGIFQGFLSQLSLFDMIAKEKETIVFDLKGTKVEGGRVRFSLVEMVGSLL